MFPQAVLAVTAWAKEDKILNAGMSCGLLSTCMENSARWVSSFGLNRRSVRQAGSMS
jgi:hypothetical protein